MHDENVGFLRGVLSAEPKVKAEAKGADEESDLPDPGADYKPHSEIAGKPVFTLHCIQRAGIIRSFQYCDLDSDSRYEPGMIKMRFSGTKVSELVIHGRNLRKLYHGIHRHIMGWVAEAPRDFAKNDECIVLRIDIVEVKKEQRVKHGHEEVEEEEHSA